MKKFILAAFVSLIASPAIADGAPCEDTAILIKRLEQDLQSASGVEAKNIKGLLAAARATYNANGCK